MLEIKRDLYGTIMSSSEGVYGSKRGWYWLRGLWGNNGSIYLPRTGYYLVFRMRTPQTAEKVLAILGNSGLKTGKRMKSGYHEILLRNQEDIVTLFSKFRLYESSLYIEQRSLVRAMRERANKLVNCDASNIRKSLEA
ncbi:MAG: DNA-binding protein WhiA, partial [Synergistales bacterium]|nr:DNA-binding protein WhiA [Synergistales bacterium]